MREVQDTVWPYGAGFKSRKTRQATWFKRAGGSVLGPTISIPVQIGRSVNYKIQISDIEHVDSVESHLRSEGLKLVEKIPR
jgi:hypothetical protein